MDGNGRWAKQRYLPRFAGHPAGVTRVQQIVRASNDIGIKVLTLFAFSSENWRRPSPEVDLLLELLLNTLRRESQELHSENVRIRIIGDRTAFSERFQQEIKNSEALTTLNTGLTLNIAINYGGRWDIANAARRLAERIEAGELKSSSITAELIQSEISTGDLPEPALFIRTGGEQRISNFLLWQLAYTELYFTDVLWPDFGVPTFIEALHWFASRQRRFGRTGEQVEAGA